MSRFMLGPTNLTHRPGWSSASGIGLAALGILAFRLGHASLYLDSSLRAIALPRDVSVLTETVRAFAVAVLFAIGARTLAGLPSLAVASRLLTPLALPVMGLAALL